MDQSADLGRLLARERVLATLSHEIRTPLNGVLGMAGLLADTRLDASQSAYLKTLRECGEHLLGLVNDALDYAKLDSGAPRLDAAPVDVEALLQGVSELLSPRAYAGGIEIAWAVEAPLPKLMTDEGRLRQILFNLAGNAVKLTSEGGVLLRASTTPAGPGIERLRLQVEDTGPGVAPEHLDTIFAEFTQTEAGRQAGGAGLGLAIVKRLAEAFNGALGVESRLGRGSTFWFEAEFAVAEPTVSKPPLGCKVAVETPSEVLQRAASSLIRASGGRIDGDAPDVVLVDASSFGPRARLKPPTGAPALILLAPEERRRIATARKAGFAGYLIKPLRRGSLAARIDDVLGRSAPMPGPVDDRVAALPPMKAHVLLAEDNPVNAFLARMLLTQMGCTVERVGTGEEAVAIALEARHDLILMDLHMPGVDGLEATRRLRAARVRTPVVALTANAFDADRQAALTAGMNDFLTKPLDPKALREVVFRLGKRQKDRCEAA